MRSGLRGLLSAFFPPSLFRFFQQGVDVFLASGSATPGLAGLSDVMTRSETAATKAFQKHASQDDLNEQKHASIFVLSPLPPGTMSPLLFSNRSRLLTHVGTVRHMCCGLFDLNFGCEKKKSRIFKVS